MAIDFLRKSEVYKNAVRSAEVLERRAAVVKLLPDTYTLEKKQIDAVFGKIRALGFRADKVTTRTDYMMYRRAWEWLVGDFSQKQAMMEQKEMKRGRSVIGLGIRCLQKEGVNSLGDLGKKWPGLLENSKMGEKNQGHFHFLERSKTWVLKTGSEVRARTDRILKELDKNYSFPVSKIPELTQKLEIEGFEGINSVKVRRAVRTWSLAFRFLTTTNPEEKEGLHRASERANEFEVVGIRYLIQDGLIDWEDVKDKPPVAKAETATAKSRRPCPSSALKAGLIEPDQRPADAGPPEKMGAESALKFFRDLNEATSEILKVIEKLAGERQKQDEVVNSQASEIKSLKARIAELEEETALLTLEVGELERTNAAIINDALTGLPLQFPGHYVELSKIIDRIKQSLKSKAAMPREFPAISSAHGGSPVRYAKRFIRTFNGLPAENKDRVVKALAVITSPSPENGAWTSLNAKRLVQKRSKAEPKGCFEAYAGEEIRLTWKFDDAKKELWFYGLHKSSTA